MHWKNAYFFLIFLITKLCTIRCFNLGEGPYLIASGWPVSDGAHRLIFLNWLTVYFRRLRRLPISWGIGRENPKWPITPGEGRGLGSCCLAFKILSLTSKLQKIMIGPKKWKWPTLLLGDVEAGSRRTSICGASAVCTCHLETEMWVHKKCT